MFSLIFTYDFEPWIWVRKRLQLYTPRYLKSRNKFVDGVIFTIWKPLNCAPCLSYHLTWILFLILFQSYIGFLIGLGTYCITKLIYKYVWSISI